MAKSNIRTSSSRQARSEARSKQQSSRQRTQVFPSSRNRHYQILCASLEHHYKTTIQRDLQVKRWRRERRDLASILEFPCDREGREIRSKPLHQSQIHPVHYNTEHQ